MRFPHLLIFAALTGALRIGAQPPPGGDSIPLVLTTLLPDTASPDSAKKKSGLTDTVRYEADIIEYDMENRRLYLTTNAVIRYQNIVLQADTIVYAIDNNLFSATGSPQLVDGLDTTVGETMVYNIKTRRGTVKHASTRMDGAFFDGQRIVKTADNVFYAQGADYTTCAHIDAPHYCFYARDVKVIPNDKAIARPAVLNIGDVPVAALPYFVLPIERKRRSGFLTPSFGGNPGSGGYLDNLGYYFAINEYVDLTLSSRIAEFQDYVMTASSRYALRYRLSGGISGRYSGGFGSQDRDWALNYSHDQNLTPDRSFTLSGRGSLVSTSRFYTLHSQDTTELLNQKINANLSLSRRFDRINAGANLVWNRDQHLQTGVIGEDLPSLSFNLPSRAVIPFKSSAGFEGKADEEPRWFNNITLSYNASAKQRNSIVPDDPTRTFLRRGMSQNININAPQKLFKVLTVNPNFQARVSLFDAWRDTAAYDTLRPDTTTRILSRRQELRGLTSVVKIDTLIDTVYLDDPPEIRYDTSYRVQQVYPLRPTPLYRTYEDQLTHSSSWNTGVGVQTTLYGIFPLRLFSVTGIRHTMTPSVNYVFTPANNLNRTFFDIGIPYDRPSSRQSQTVRFSVGNQFQGKRLLTGKDGEKPREEKFQILSNSVSASYDFEKESRKWSDLQVSASTSYKVVNLSLGSTYWLYDEQGAFSYLPLLSNYSITLSPTTGLNASGTLWSGDRTADSHTHEGVGPKWNLSLGPSYTFSKARPSLSEPFVTTKSYRLGASAALDFSSIWRVSWNGSYDFVANRMVGHNLDFTCDLECWAMRFNWRPSGVYPGFHFMINIKQIPEIKWEKRN